MGRIVGPRLAGRFARAILELGGNNAAIVCPSAVDDDLVKSRVANYSNGLVTTGDVYVTWQSQRCKSGESVKVEATTNYHFITPLGAFLPGPLRLTASSTMRVE